MIWWVHPGRMGPDVDRHSIRGGKIEEGITEVENATFPNATNNLFMHFGTNNLGDRANNEEDLVSLLLCKYEDLV